MSEHEKKEELTAEELEEVAGGLKMSRQEDPGGSTTHEARQKEVSEPLPEPWPSPHGH